MKRHDIIFRANAQLRVVDNTDGMKTIRKLRVQRGTRMENIGVYPVVKQGIELATLELADGALAYHIPYNLFQFDNGMTLLEPDHFN